MVHLNPLTGGVIKRNRFFSSAHYKYISPFFAKDEYTCFRILFFLLFQIEDLVINSKRPFDFKVMANRKQICVTRILVKSI